MKLIKGSAAAKAYMAKIRAKKGTPKKTAAKKVGATKKEVYIEFMNPAKGFKTDKKYFNTYNDAVKFMDKNFEKRNIDMIKYVSAAKKVGSTLKFEEGYFKVLGKKNGQLVEITENPLNYTDAKKFIKEQGIERYYTNVDIVPYRGNKKPVKYMGSTLNLHKKETRLGMPPKTTSKSGNGYHKDTKSHNVKISVISGINNNVIEDLKFQYEQLKKWNFILDNLKIEATKKYADKGLIAAVKMDITRVKNHIKDIKKTITNLNRKIK